MKKNHDIITIQCDLRHETDRAFLVDAGSGKPQWVPKSMCEYEDGELQIPEWLAIDKELV